MHCLPCSYTFPLSLPPKKGMFTATAPELQTQEDGTLLLNGESINETP